VKVESYFTSNYSGKGHALAGKAKFKEMEKDCSTQQQTFKRKHCSSIIKLHEKKRFQNQRVMMNHSYWWLPIHKHKIEYNPWSKVLCCQASSPPPSHLPSISKTNDSNFFYIDGQIFSKVIKNIQWLKTLWLHVIMECLLWDVRISRFSLE